MKKFWILFLISFCLAAGFYRLVLSPAPVSPDPRLSPSQEQDQKMSSGDVLHPSMKIEPVSTGEKAKNPDRMISNLPIQSAKHPDLQKSRGALAASSVPAKPVTITAAPVSPSGESNESGPSIGTVKVLGHRGCNLNTQGWFLSVGNPELYDFTVSEDGETLVVEPNSPNLTGGFEFIHCADPGPFTGKRVRFSAKIKAQGVIQVAQLRLRGEDFKQERNLYTDVKVGGTYDWRDFSLEADVSPEVSLFSYGLTFRSQGKLWIRQPTFAVIP